MFVAPSSQRFVVLWAVTLLVTATLALVVGTSPAEAVSPSAQCDFDNDGYDDLPIGAPGEDGPGAAVKDSGSVNVIYGSATGISGRSEAWHQDTAGIAGVREVDDRFGSSLACGDFDGDGFDDLAIGAPGEDLGQNQDAGLVHVIYGSATGLTATGSQVWHQNSSGIKGVALAFDTFGWALVAGDFDNDGFDDLVVGVPGEDANTNPQTQDEILTGGINVLYGSSNGVSDRDQLFTQDSPGVLGKSEINDEFGAALAVGDFDGDGVDDVAVGAPGEAIGNVERAGTVNVLYGVQGSGLSAAGDQAWHLDSVGIKGVATLGDEFGRDLAAGDFDNDGFDDLAIGLPGRKVGGNEVAGAVSVLFGAASGLTDRDQFITQDSAGIKGVAEAGDLFGWVLDAADVDGDGFVDLAIGVPLDDDGGIAAGGVAVLYGGSSGVTTRDQLLLQGSPGVRGVAEDLDSFGEAVVFGDFDGDGFFDLAVGVPEEDVGSLTNAGTVSVLYGTGSGITAVGDELLSQDSPGVPGVAEAGDFFGFVTPLQRPLDLPGTSALTQAHTARLER